MEQFILGIPKKSDDVVDNVTRFTSVQDAAAACKHSVLIYTDDYEKALLKFTDLHTRNFMPQ